MFGKRLWIAVLTVVTTLAASAVAQDEKNEIGGTLGRTFISNQGIKGATFPNPNQVLLPGMLKVGNVILDVHTMLMCAFSLIIGVQMIFTGLLSTVYCHGAGILPVTPKFSQAIKQLTLEKLLVF